MKTTITFILAFAFLVFKPQLTPGQTVPDLGTASVFSLFTSIGAFTNSGATSVTGNIGTNAGALDITGVTLIEGSVHVADGLSGTAATDLSTAYTALNQGGTVIGIGLGGQTLVAGVYQTGGASTLNGVLTLDGDLSNNSAWAETFPVDFFLPEGFSPQGDGINDLFIIRGIFSFPYNSITIYNRWGNKVFEASPYQNGWDGRSMRGLKAGGDELHSGTYFYLLDLGDGSQVIKGTVYLNR